MNRSLKELQQEVAAFTGENDMEASAEIRLMDTFSELGELSKELLKSGDYGRKAAASNADTTGEMGDCLYSLITLANALGIDMEEALEGALSKYRRRLEKGSAGSENDVNSDWL